MIHLDLFSGIGGFAYAVDQVWENAEHIFCDNDKFCRQVLKKHWPKSKIYNDIRTITDTNLWESRPRNESEPRETAYQEFSPNNTSCANWECGQSAVQQDSNGVRFPYAHIDLLTGGFPCQPFSQAGKRRGTTDDRFLWPEMLRVIQLTQPQWVIAENVRGILTIEGGMVLEQVCLDLEAEGYEVQPLIIPAVAVNAPHRRDRVWFVANRTSERPGTGERDRQERHIQNDQGASEKGESERNRWERGSGEISANAPNPRQQYGEQGNEQGMEADQTKRTARPTDAKRQDKNASDTTSKCGTRLNDRQREGQFRRSDWNQNWLEVATELCGMDDGLPAELDFAGWTKAGHRVQRLKALGNSIVPQVAIEILKSLNI